MPERIPENNDPLNKLAKAMLKLVGVYPHPDALYCLQLAEWGISTGKLDLGKYPEIFTENLDAFLYRWKPKAVMEFLKGPDEDEIQWHVPRGPIRPLSLAWAVLDQIESRVIAEAPYD